VTDHQHDFKPVVGECGLYRCECSVYARRRLRGGGFKVQKYAPELKKKVTAASVRIGHRGVLDFFNGDEPKQD
jgi:hypothetical protein